MVNDYCVLQSVGIEHVQIWSSENACLICVAIMRFCLCPSIFLFNLSCCITLNDMKLYSFFNFQLKSDSEIENLGNLGSFMGYRHSCVDLLTKFYLFFIFSYLLYLNWNRNAYCPENNVQNSNSVIWVTHWMQEEVLRGFDVFGLFKELSPILTACGASYHLKGNMYSTCVQSVLT